MSGDPLARFVRAIPDSGARTTSQDGGAAARLEKIAERLEQEASTALATNTSEPAPGKILTRILGNAPAAVKVASATAAEEPTGFRDTTLQSILSDVLRGGAVVDEADRSGAVGTAETGMPKAATAADIRAALGGKR